MSWMVLIHWLHVLSAIVWMGGARSSSAFEQRVWDGDQFRPGARAYIARSRAITLTGFLVILALMVLMRFGY